MAGDARRRRCSSRERDGADVAARLIERLPIRGVRRRGDDARLAPHWPGRAQPVSTDVPFRFDAADPNGLVLELAGSPTARSSAAGLLAPLEQLGGHKATAAIETLRVYLDCWGSPRPQWRDPAPAPERRRAPDETDPAVLPVDLDDPDQRLALQIDAGHGRPGRRAMK